MNELFAQTSEFGEFRYDEIFLYYDVPCIFSVKNMLGHRFICLLETENENLNRYVITPVSIARYHQFVKNEIPIRNIFTQSEAGGVFCLTINNEAISEVSLLEKEDFAELNLPAEKEFLDIKESYTLNDLIYDAVEKNVPIIKKSLEKLGGHRPFIYAKELANESMSFQKVFDGLYKDMLRNDNITEKAQKSRLKIASQVPIVGTYAASFGITIEGMEFPCIGETETDFGKFIKKYFEIININETTPSIFFKSNKEALKALKAYYKFLISQGFDVKLSAATPSRKFYKTSLNRNEIIRKYSFLNNKIADETEQIFLIGHWIDVNMGTSSFKFKTVTEEVIDGKFDENFEESVFDFSTDIRILLDKHKESDKMGEQFEKYTLLSIVE